MADQAREAFARARVASRANRNQVGIGQTALHELGWVTLPYRTGRVAEREALATEAEQAWMAGGGALNADDPPGLARLRNLHLDGQWAETRRLACAVRGANNDAVRRLLATRMLGELARAGRDGPRVDID